MIDEAPPNFLWGGEEDAFAAFRSSAVSDTLGAVGGAVGSMASGHSVAPALELEPMGDPNISLDGLFLVIS